jgi:hypothetical protein
MRYDQAVDDLLATAATLFRETGLGDDLRLLGGTAVALHVGTAARLTHDLDIAAMNEGARVRLLDQLRADGYRVGESGGWSRAARTTPASPLIDIASNPVVSPRTFDAVRLRAAPKRVTVAGVEIVVAGVDDLLLLKLLAARDQDLLDIALLCGCTGASADAVAASATSDDVERAASSGAARGRHALENGEMASLFDELLGRPLDEPTSKAFQQFLDMLHRRGL